jgi:tetratricopeptide (TPR) repeat protein
MRPSTCSISTLLLALGCTSATLAPAPATAPRRQTAPAATTSMVSDVTQSDWGQLQFAITGSAACQEAFRQGVLAMHSFLYDQAHERFAAALGADPRCAMAAWGDAMAYNHPIWRQRDRAKALAALGAIHSEDRLTAKERAYLQVARALYTEPDEKLAQKAWLAAAAAMAATYPDDDEVALQHTLALLAVYGYNPKHVGEQMLAGSIALQVLQRRPEHPGAAHYVIHSFDSRDHAILALPASRVYARIAPAAGHAVHMPSHTFTHLGMWNDVIPSNERAYASSVAWEQSRGHSPSRYDWHSYSWLVGALLETGQHRRARALIDDARKLLVATTDDSGDFRQDYASMVAAYLTHSEKWSELEELIAPVFAATPDEGGGSGAVACADHAPGAGGAVRMPSALFARQLAHVLRAEAAIAQGAPAKVEAAIGSIKEVRAQMAAWEKMLPPEAATYWEAVFAQLTARAQVSKKSTPAQLAAAAAALERLEQLQAARPTAGPMWTKPAIELLAEFHLRHGKSKDALDRFERDLELRPNRAVALIGAARAARALGDAARAERYQAALAELWRNADADLELGADVGASSPR